MLNRPATKTRNNHFMAWGKPMLSMHSVIKLNGNVAVGLSLCCTADRSRASYSRGAALAIKRAKDLTFGARPLLGQLVFSDFEDFTKFRKLLRGAEYALGSNAAYHFYRETFFNTRRGALARLESGQAYTETKKAMQDKMDVAIADRAKKTADYDRGFADGIAHAANHMEAWGEHAVAKELRAWQPTKSSEWRMPAFVSEAPLQGCSPEFAEEFVTEYPKLFGTTILRLTAKHSLAKFARTWKPKA